MSKLLNRAKINLLNAKNDYRNFSIDDAYVDDCCYNLQQCIEKTLKFIVEMTGKEYVKSHDIRAQLNILQDIKNKLPYEKELRDMAWTINEWEASSRYKDNFVALQDDIDCAMKYAEALVQYAENLYSSLDSMNSF